MRRLDWLAAIYFARYVNFNKSEESESASAANFLIDWWREPEPEDASIDQHELAEKLKARFKVVAPAAKDNSDGK